MHMPYYNMLHYDNTSDNTNNNINNATYHILIIINTMLAGLNHN